MARKNHSVEQIIGKLLEAEVRLGQGETVAQVCRSLGVKDELLNGEVFYSLRKAEVLIEAWRRHYNTNRPHSALGYRRPAPEVVLQHRPVPAFAHEGLQPERASEQMANKLTIHMVWS